MKGMLFPRSLIIIIYESTEMFKCFKKKFPIAISISFINLVVMKDMLPGLVEVNNYKTLTIYY